MKITFLPQARQEWLAAIEYYNEQRTNLGYEFALEVDRALQRVQQYPYAWTKVGERTHRMLVHRFPYGLLYCVEPDQIIVTVVMDLRQQPQERP